MASNHVSRFEYPSNLLSSNIRVILRTVGASALIVSLLITSLALPSGAGAETLAPISSGIRQQSEMAATNIGGDVDMTAASAQIDSFYGVVEDIFFPRFLAKLIGRDNKNKKDKIAAIPIDRIAVKPGTATVLAGDRLDLVATGYTGEDPKTGVLFTWTYKPVGDPGPGQVFYNGRFSSDVAGQFTITATGEGIQSQGVVTVKDNPLLPIIRVLRKPDAALTAAERTLIAQWTAAGLLKERTVRFPY